MTSLDSAMVNILKNRLYVYDGIIDNLTDALGMVDLSIESLSVLNNILLEINNNVANISNPHTTDGSVGNLRTNCSDLVNEYSSVVFHSRYNENKVLITVAADGNPENVSFNYSLPGVNDDVGGSRDNFIFVPPAVGVSVVPSLDIKITDGEGNAVNDADGAPLNCRLTDFDKDMTNSENITNEEIRHRAEQYVVVLTESIRDINKELQNQKANKRRLEFRKSSIQNLKGACYDNFKQKKTSSGTTYE